MENIVNARALFAAAVVVTVAIIPITYIMRPDNRMPVRGVWLPILGGFVAVLCVIGWAVAWRSGFDSQSVRLAIVASVPVAQLAALVVSLYLFYASLGRLPDGFSIGGGARSNADVLMHAFVVFALMIAPLVFTKVLLQR
jgi:hypothetical protein